MCYSQNSTSSRFWNLSFKKYWTLIQEIYINSFPSIASTKLQRFLPLNAQIKSQRHSWVFSALSLLSFCVGKPTIGNFHCWKPVIFETTIHEYSKYAEIYWISVKEKVNKNITNIIRLPWGFWEFLKYVVWKQWHLLHKIYFHLNVSWVVFVSNL